MLCYRLVDAGNPWEIAASSSIGEQANIFNDRTNGVQQGQLGTDSSLPARASMYTPHIEAILNDQVLPQAGANARPLYSSPLRTR